MNDLAASWTHGGEHIVYQQCAGCGKRWYFERAFCPHCGKDAPVGVTASGAGRVIAVTLVHRAPDDAFRAIAPYAIVLVDADEGFRLMAHADPTLAVGDRVHASVRTIAGRRLPWFDKNASP